MKLYVSCYQMFGVEDATTLSWSSAQQWMSEWVSYQIDWTVQTYKLPSAFTTPGFVRSSSLLPVPRAVPFENGRRCQWYIFSGYMLYTSEVPSEPDTVASQVINKLWETGFQPAAPLLASNQASLPTFESRKIYKSISGISISSISIPLPVSPNPSKSMQNTHTHLTLLCYIVIEWYRQTRACRNSYFSLCNLLSRLYVLRSLPNLHCRKDQFLASLFEYNVAGFE